MSTVSDVRDRLLEAGTPFTTVLGATALARVKEGHRPEGVTLPVCFVLMMREVTADNERATGSIFQRSERDLMCVYVVDDVSNDLGAASADLIEDVIKPWVRGKLIGFVPTDMVDPITHVGGEITEARESAVWFEDTFSAPIYIQEQS
jgi:hypothetical protein